jgi:hypothetical protein
VTLRANYVSAHLRIGDGELARLRLRGPGGVGPRCGLRGGAVGAARVVTDAGPAQGLRRAQRARVNQSNGWIVPGATVSCARTAPIATLIASSPRRTLERPAERGVRTVAKRTQTSARLSGTRPQPGRTKRRYVQIVPERPYPLGACRSGRTGRLDVVTDVATAEQTPQVVVPAAAGFESRRSPLRGREQRRRAVSSPSA